VADEDDIFTATEDEFEALSQLAAAVDGSGAHANAELRLDPEAQPIEVPASLLPLISRAAREMAGGGSFAIIEADSELTIDEAAELLGEAPETVSKLVGGGEIPHRVVDERRLRLRDVLRYRRRRNSGRREALDELTRLSEDYGLYS
jgi:hypothetical protein